MPGHRVGTVTDGTTTYYFGAYPDSINIGGNGVLAKATATSSSGFNADANYAVFSGLSGTGQTISTLFYSADGVTDNWGGICAIQVVESASVVTKTIGIYIIK